MKEFIYTFIRCGYFLETSKNTASFGNDNEVRLIITPIDYEMKISDEILINAHCGGYIIEITSNGAANIYDYKNKLLASSKNNKNTYREFKFEWTNDALHISFGQTETIDNYPHCDGEYDRWSTEWVTKHEIIFNTNTNECETR